MLWITFLSSFKQIHAYLLKVTTLVENYFDLSASIVCIV